MSAAVIESASEDEQVKRQIYGEVCPLLKPEAILASKWRPGLVAVIDVTTPRMVASAPSKVTKTAWVTLRRIRKAARLTRER